MIVKALNPKKYIEMFSAEYELVQGDNYFFAITPNEFDDFRQFSYVNGLNVSSGGTHIEVIVNEIVNGIREKLIKKYKTIKPGDIKNKLRVIAVMRDFPNLQFDSQTKERVTNSVKDIKDYFGEIDYDGLVKKILKNTALIDPITEVYKIKEELKKRQEEKALDKKVKKVKSEKYYSAIHHPKYLILGEGHSAISALMPVLGRDNFAFYELKGKPANLYEGDHSKLSANKELSDLYRIIKNEEPNYIIIASDQDLDGAHIRYLLFGFIVRFLPEYIEKIGVFQTPVMMTLKNGIPQNWIYNFGDELPIKSGEISKYLKGLGSWEKEQLKYVISKDGLDNMMQLVHLNDMELLDEWLSKKSSDKRKEYITENIFDITKV